MEDGEDGEAIKMEREMGEYLNPDLNTEKRISGEKKKTRKKNKSIHMNNRKGKCKRRSEEDEETALLGAIDEEARLPD